MTGWLEADQRYHWRATLERTNEVRDVLKLHGFIFQIKQIATSEVHKDCFENVVSITCGIAPGIYEVQCTHGCLSLLRDTLGDAMYY
jgi:hypothetical protein